MPIHVIIYIPNEALLHIMHNTRLLNLWKLKGNEIESTSHSEINIKSS